MLKLKMDRVELFFITQNAVLYKSYADCYQRMLCSYWLWACPTHNPLYYVNQNFRYCFGNYPNALYYFDKNEF